MLARATQRSAFLCFFGTNPLFTRLFRPFLSLKGQVCTWFVNSPLVSRELKGKNVRIDAIQQDLSVRYGLSKATYHRSPMQIHLLSNIIDVEGICSEAIAKAILAPQNRSFVVCVGHRATLINAMQFLQCLREHDTNLLHWENIQYSAALENGYRFGWDIRIMRRGMMSKAA